MKFLHAAIAGAISLGSTAAFAQDTGPAPADQAATPAQPATPATPADPAADAGAVPATPATPAEPAAKADDPLAPDTAAAVETAKPTGAKVKTNKKPR